jgi:hypothetical protein
MSSTSTTDEGLAHFEQLSELKSVVIYSQEGSITDAGIKGLQAALPSCKIKNEPSDGSSPRVQISTYQEGEFAELVDTQVKLPNSDQELEEFLLGSTWRPSEFDGALLEFEEERMTIMAHVWATKISGRRNVTIHRGELHPGIGTIFDLISPSAYIVFAEDMSSLTVLDGQDLKPKWTASFVRNGADDKSSAE